MKDRLKSILGMGLFLLVLGIVCYLAAGSLKEADKRYLIEGIFGR